MYTLYALVRFIGFLIRQFVLPNPFTPLGDMAIVVNWIVGGVFIPLSYFETGLFYDRGSEPALGSFLFNLFYMINTGITYLIMLAYPYYWLIGIITVAYLLVIGLFVKLRNSF